MTPRSVTITTRTVGQNFGVVGVVRHASNGRKIFETDPRPYGYNNSAWRAAEFWAAVHGYIVRDGADGK